MYSSYLHKNNSSAYKWLRVSAGIISTFFLVISFLSPKFVEAQQIFGPSDVSIQFSPVVPGPHQNVTATLESFVIDLDMATITWFVNKKEVVAGVGEKIFRFTTGGTNDVFDIEIDIRWNEINRIIKRIRIQPADMDFLWQAVDSYVPPFYKGKALPASESTVRIVAVPQNGNASDEYVYTWQRAGTVDQSQSGYRKNTFTTKNNFFDTQFRASVSAVSRDGQYQIQKNIDIPRFNPKILLRQINAEGVATPVGANISAREGSFFLSVIPLFFSTASFENLKTDWRMNNQPYTSDNPFQLYISPAPDATGSSLAEVHVVHAKNILQDVKSSIRIDF